MRPPVDRRRGALARSRFVRLDEAMLQTVSAEPRRAVMTVNGARLIADRSGAAMELETRTLLVADLHFEKGSAFAARGRFLPPYDTRATILRLADAIARLRPARVVALGDSFHDLGADGRIHVADADALAALVRSVGDWLWIEGNHDPEPPARFGGRIAHEARLGPLVLRHEPQAGDRPGEVAGHLHPCARIAVRGRALRRRCFATDGSRLVMPAFGAFTGGLNVCDPAWAPIFEARPTAWMTGDTGVFPVCGSKLRPD
ncbi:MAG: ligase-associated DNA damage response endonuclease PdeM [Oceanicaulis sp.]